MARQLSDWATSPPVLFVCRLRGAESSRPDPPVEVLLAGDPDVGPDVALCGPSWKTHLLSRLQTQQVSTLGTSSS